MIGLMKKAVWIGLGMAEQAREVLDDLAKKGETCQSETAKRIKNLFEQGEKVEDEGKQKIADLLTRSANCFKIPSRSDIERLEKGLSDLADEIRGRKGTA